MGWYNKKKKTLTVLIENTFGHNGLQRSLLLMAGTIQREKADVFPVLQTGT